MEIKTCKKEECPYNLEGECLKWLYEVENEAEMISVEPYWEELPYGDEWC